MILTHGKLHKDFKPKRIIHVGRKCPKGYDEEANGMHLGKGIWMLNCVLKDEK